MWSAIYDQSCFSNLNDTDTCQEQRVFYRLISGECHVPAVMILHRPRPSADFVVLIAAQDPGWTVLECHQYDVQVCMHADFAVMACMHTAFAMQACMHLSVRTCQMST